MSQGVIMEVSEGKKGFELIKQDSTGEKHPKPHPLPAATQPISTQPPKQTQHKELETPCQNHIKHCIDSTQSSPTNARPKRQPHSHHHKC